MDDIIEKSAMRKIYLRLLPFAILSYFLAYIDRINVSFARPKRIATLIGTTSGASRGASSLRPSTALSTEIAGVIIPSP